MGLSEMVGSWYKKLRVLLESAEPHLETLKIKMRRLLRATSCHYGRSITLEESARNLNCEA